MAKTVVIALGGNAITREFEEGNIYQQFANTRKALVGVVDLAEAGYNIVITHGNGPQVGNALFRVEESRQTVPPVPLGVIVADLMGGMGYMISQTMINKLRERNVERNVVTIVTQVLVDKDDLSILDPTKFVGPFYNEEQVLELREKRGYTIKEDSNRGWRRVVPSPEPLEIVEKNVINKLVYDGDIVIAAGGGGAPVYYDDAGKLEGVDAVIDKDKASAILANDINAEELIILTATDYVYINFNTPEQKKLESISAAELRKYYEEDHFPAGSMGPKVKAALDFIERGGKKVVITTIENAKAAVKGTAGTIIT